MRYEDWDILVFPGGEGGGRIPTPEFRVQCYAVHDPSAHPHGPQVIPLMTCFIPSLEHGAPFQISLHAWGQPRFFFAANSVSDENIQRHVWHVQLVVDGVIQAIETFGSDVQWPKVLAQSNVHLIDGITPLLQFPYFHRSAMSQGSWNAMDDTGRIKLEISEGWLTADGKAFHRLTTHAIFNFQPAPLELLQRTGVAWPNPSMMAHPLPHHPISRQPSTGSLFGRDTHSRHASIQSTFSAASAGNFSSSPAFSGTLPPQPPPPTPNSVARGSALHGFAFDGSSRSTSAYTDLSQAALPLTTAEAFALSGAAGSMPPYVGEEAAYQRNQSNEVKLRIPSDQLNQVLRAISEKREGAESGPSLAAQSMPPPPLPQHVIQARATHSQGESRLQSPVMADCGAQVSEEDLTHGNRRIEACSNTSDVSMHADCGEFPSCTSEDAHGHLIHHTTGVAPAAVMRSRKEGSVELTNRDFFSHVLNQSDGCAGSSSSGASIHQASTIPSSSPAIGSTKKRTRSALKQVNVNEAGSPEKETSKPARKVWRSTSDEENIDQEQMIMVDV